MADVDTSIVINRPAEEIFDHWADGRLQNNWAPTAIKKDVRLVTPEPIGAGSRFRGTFKGAGEVEYQILTYDRPRRLAMVTRTKMGELHHDIELEGLGRTGGGMRVRQQGTAAFSGVFRLLRPFLLMVFRRSFRQNEQALKRYLEGRTGADALPQPPEQSTGSARAG